MSGIPSDGNEFSKVVIKKGLIFNSTVYIRTPENDVFPLIKEKIYSHYFITGDALH